MVETEVGDLLTLAKDVVSKGLQSLSGIVSSDRSYHYAENLPREIKAAADNVLDKEIIDRLAPTDLPILTEESGALTGSKSVGLRWIVDPLDGTANFVRGLATCAISVALYNEDKPVFGVIGAFPTLKLAWGGAIVWCIL